MIMYVEFACSQFTNTIKRINKTIASFSLKFCEIIFEDVTEYTKVQDNSIPN